MKKVILISLLLVGCNNSEGISVEEPNEQNNSEYYVYEKVDEGNEAYQRIKSQKASFEDILQVFKCEKKSTLRNKLYALTPYTHDSKVVSVLENIWNNDKEIYPDFSWHLLNRDDSRTIVAYLLYLGSEKEKGIDGDTYINFIRSKLKDGSANAKINAAENLGFIAMDQDVGALKELAYGEDMNIAISGTLGLLQMNTEKANVALRELETDSNLSDEKKSILKSVINAYAEAASN